MLSLSLFVFFVFFFFFFMSPFQNNDDIQHVVTVHDAFGKGFVKTMKVTALIMHLLQRKPTW